MLQSHNDSSRVEPFQVTVEAPPELRLRTTGLGRLGNLNEAARLHVVDVAVDRDVLRHERVLPNPLHILHYARREVVNRLEVDVARIRAAVVVGVVPVCLMI